MFRIGIDVGGTFTDFVVVREGESPRYFKTASTPSDPSEAVVAGLADVATDYDLSPQALLSDTDLIIHGTTVATNTLIERKGANVALLTTDGFRDLLEMREGLKEDRYNLRMKQVEPLVPRFLRLGIPERIRSDGTVECELDVEALNRALDELSTEDVDALAVCFLFSYMNPEHERIAARMIAERFPDTYTSLSHEVIPQIKEFDRLSTTVVNSYVGPVFGRYLDHLRSRFEAFDQPRDVLIMQSNGGVSSIDDSIRLAAGAILSGPAGGVSGASYYGELAGESKIIGFDMGGTSTDISLVEDGRPHTSIEKFEGGWKIALPMIDVQTLGAGGGSIARVDPGGILRIGPDSAGADPGPACYGRGGLEPTVTDANLALGYLDAQNFLGGKATLDVDLARQSIRDNVAEQLDIPVEVAAEGIHDLVSTNISEGIRVISSRLGVDPRDFAIVAFGGAAGLQVSKVASQLQIAKAYVPPAAPVLSAYGMLSTDLRYDFSRSYPASLNSLDMNALRGLASELSEQGKARLHEQGVSDDRIQIDLTADMRYLDQIYEVNVSVPDLASDDDAIIEEWTASFHERYEELYSYHQSGQEVRLVTLRAAVTGSLPRIEMPELVASSSDTVTTTRRVYLDGWRDVTVYTLDSISPGDEITGPAIIESEFTTVLLMPGDVASLDKHGGIEIQIAQAVESIGEVVQTEAPDPITVAIVENRLESIALEMMEVMLRTSMSQILNSSRDFSTCILDADCQLVAQGEGIPVHISALPIAGEAIKNFFGDTIRDGDLYAVNDPYFGGSHLPDITVIRPIFYDGKLMFFSVNRAHHSDLGGPTHGGYNPSASEIFHEGLRIPPVRLYDAGVARDDLLHMMSVNVRNSENFLGDLNAQIGSVDTAARRIQTLLDAYGPDQLTKCVNEVMSATERQVRQFITEWPDGTYKGESFVDDDGFGYCNVPIRASVIIEGDTMTIDLSESSDQVTGFINSAYANTRSIAHAAIMYMAPADVAKNEGSMRPVRVVAPRGLVVNANPPAPVCMSTNHCAEEIVEAIFKAMALAVPDAVTAGFSRRLRYAITGVDPRTDRTFIWHFFMARGGGGASNGYDGWSNVGEVNVAGGIRSPSVEVTEERFPLFVKRHELRPGSAGDGEWRGGLGTVCEIVYEGNGDASLNTAGDGTINPPFGLYGADAGLPHIYSLVSNGNGREMHSKETGVVVHPGDQIVCLSSGGGGYGDPDKRDSDLRDWDAKNGYVDAP